MLRQHEVRAARADASGVYFTFHDRESGEESTVRYDAAVLATGYERAAHRDVLAPLAPYLGDFTVDRHYRVQTAPGFRPAIFLQGACESSHGLSDTLLSVTAVRTGEIGQVLAAALPPAREPLRTRGPDAPARGSTGGAEAPSGRRSTCTWPEATGPLPAAAVPGTGSAGPLRLPPPCGQSGPCRHRP